jgi:hypothetical protein
MRCHHHQNDENTRRISRYCSSDSASFFCGLSMDTEIDLDRYIVSTQTIRFAPRIQGVKRVKKGLTGLEIWSNKQFDAFLHSLLWQFSHRKYFQPTKQSFSLLFVTNMLEFHSLMSLRFRIKFKKKTWKRKPVFNYILSWIKFKYFAYTGREQGLIELNWPNKY